MAPLVTVGVVSYNRLLYLRTLLASLRECVTYPNVQWILVDGCSQERGLREYAESLDFLDELVFEPSGRHADAMNHIVRLARGDFLMILPEDVQFIVRGPWLGDLAEVAADPRVGQIVFDAQRRITIERHFRRTMAKGRVLPFPRPHRTYRSSRGREFLGYGWTRPGIGGAGIMTFGRTEIWRGLGPWRTNEELTTTFGSDLGAEDDMLNRFRASGRRLEHVLMRLPVAADVITDPRGGKARVRAGLRRYGRYAPPPDGSLYYRVYDEDEFERLYGAIRPAPGFEDVVEPAGWELPLDEAGNLKKDSIVREGEPYELVET